MNLTIPKNYKSILTLKETEIAIKQIKDFFEEALAKALNLTRVSAPLFVMPQTGLNDNLNGFERPVSFGIREQGDAVCEIVHSLAKWKRNALGKYGFTIGEGLYTDMNAIRRDEITDNIHSIYVDQWDWEKVIAKEQRTAETLKDSVRNIYSAFIDTENFISSLYNIEKTLPKEITFITTQQLEDKYPDTPPSERESLAAKEYGAIFLMQIGGILESGKKHDGRAPDYDDWSLNGDIIVYYSLLDIALELSSMGIRVDEDTLRMQLTSSDCTERLQFPFHKSIMEGLLPYSIGGGIGQSRICMFMLKKAHIGEVNASVWPLDMQKQLAEAGINLL